MQFIPVMDWKEFFRPILHIDSASNVINKIFLLSIFGAEIYTLIKMLVMCSGQCPVWIYALLIGCFGLGFPLTILFILFLIYTLKGGNSD